MIQQNFSAPTATKASKFEVGTVHQNRNGFYEILSLQYPNATIRYQNGTEKVCNLAALRHIEAKILYGSGE